MPTNSDADVNIDGQHRSRWRCRDLQGEIARHFGVEMHERTVGKLLARLNFSRVSVACSLSTAS